MSRDQPEQLKSQDHHKKPRWAPTRKPQAINVSVLKLVGLRKTWHCHNQVKYGPVGRFRADQ
jgi:hypothetical protein